MRALQPRLCKSPWQARSPAPASSAAAGGTPAAPPPPQNKARRPMTMPGSVWLQPGVIPQSVRSVTHSFASLVCFEWLRSAQRVPRMRKGGPCPAPGKLWHSICLYMFTDTPGARGKPLVSERGGRALGEGGGTYAQAGCVCTGSRRRHSEHTAPQPRLHCCMPRGEQSMHVGPMLPRELHAAEGWTKGGPSKLPWNRVAGPHGPGCPSLWLGP